MTATKTKVLFVDDEPQILRFLQLLFKPLVGEWETGLAHSGAEALERLAQEEFDIVVSDMRMPGMNGVELLNEVTRRHPQTVRIILSGYADQEAVQRAIGVTHLYLSKPVEPKFLRAVLLRIRSLNGRMRKSRVRGLVSGLGRLPSIPRVYFQIMTALESSHVPSSEIARIVTTDPGLTAKLLQIANSAYAGAATAVTHPEEAVSFLGVGLIAALALTHQLFASLDPRKYREFEVEQLWNHSVQTGLLARRIARIEARDAPLAELAFTAGLLHDVGKLILLDNLEDSYRQVRRKAKEFHVPLRQAELAEYHVDHAEVGGYLLGIWGLPAPLVEAVHYHHEPQRSHETEFGALVAVHVANVWSRSGMPSRSDMGEGVLDLPFLTRLNLLDQAQRWQAELNAERQP